MDKLLSTINPEQAETPEAEPPALSAEIENMIKKVEKPASRKPAHVTTDAANISAARKARARRRYISPPTDLVFTPTDISIQLDWTASTSYGGIGGYKISRDGVEIADINATTYTDEGLTASTQYTYAIYAYNQYQGTSGIISGTATTNAGP